MRRSEVTRRRFLETLLATAAWIGARPLRPPAWASAAPRVPTSGVRFGVQTWPQNVTWKEISGLWREADALGYDSAFAFDHLIPIRDDPSGPCFEGWTLLSALAAETEKLAVGLLVTGNTYRNPALLAKMAATVDHVSGGRVILGMGAGWFELEHRAYDFPFHTPGGRARRLVESVEVVKSLFTQKRSNFDGKYYKLKDAPFEPTTIQKPHPPILIGGMGPKVIQPLAARHADVWHFFANEPNEAKSLNAGFDEICRNVGRAPADVARSVSLRAADLAGASSMQIRERIRALQGAGVSYFILSLQAPYDRTLLQRFAREVIAELRGHSQTMAVTRIASSSIHTGDPGCQ